MNKKHIMKRLTQRGFTFEQIGSLFDISKQRVYQICQHIKADELENLSPANKLEGRDYTREAVRMRDGYTCQICGLKWKSGRKLDTHHFDNKKENTRRYDKISEMNQLITLCHDCHLNLPAHRKAMSIANRKKNEYLRKNK